MAVQGATGNPDRDDVSEFGNDQYVFKKNVITARRYVEGDRKEGRDNVAIWDEICDPDIVMKGGAGYGEIHGLENLKKVVGGLHNAATREINVEETIAERDRVTVIYTVTVTPKAPLTLPGGISVPADKKFSMSGISIIRLRNGKVIEEDAWADWLSVSQQLGVDMIKR
jgi:predicted ester cyclase